MESNARAKLEKILKGELKYTSSNLAFNMMIAKMQKKIRQDEEDMDSCMKEMDEFFAKYPIVAKVDLANIAAL